MTRKVGNMALASQRHRVAVLLAAGALVIGAAACSGSDDPDANATTPPVPTNPTTTEGTNSDTTTSTSSTSTTTPTDTTQSPPTLPPTTSTTQPERPTVTTLVPEADPDLVTQRQDNPDDINNNRPIRREDMPVVEAYLDAIQKNYQVYASAPLDPSSSILTGAPMTAGSLAAAQEFLRGRSGQVLNVDQGVTFRPWIVGPVGETATLYDCELAGHYWEMVATEEPVPPDDVWFGSPGQIVEVGLQVDMVFREGQWLVDTSQIEPAACS